MELLSELPVARRLAGGFLLQAMSLRVWFVLIVLACLWGCATGPKLVWHKFSIDGWFDGWAKEAVLLEFRYGREYTAIARRNENGLGYSMLVGAPMPLGDSLYVRWRIKETGEVVEKTVDLRGRLSKNMVRALVTFVIDGRDLYVYVVMPEDVGAKSDGKPMKTFLSKYRKTYEIFPGR